MEPGQRWRGCRQRKGRLWMDARRARGSLKAPARRQARRHFSRPSAHASPHSHPIAAANEDMMGVPRLVTEAAERGKGAGQARRGWAQGCGGAAAARTTDGRAACSPSVVGSHVLLAMPAACLLAPGHAAPPPTYRADDARRARLLCSDHLQPGRQAGRQGRAQHSPSLHAFSSAAAAAQPCAGRCGRTAARHTKRGCR